MLCKDLSDILLTFHCLFCVDNKPSNGPSGKNGVSSKEKSTSAGVVGVVRPASVDAVVVNAAESHGGMKVSVCLSSEV